MGIQSAWERRESARDPGATFPDVLLQHQPGTALPGPPATGNTTLSRLGPTERSASFTQKAPLGTLFLEKLLVETQIVLELCIFKKGTILPHLKHTTDSPPPPVTWPALQLPVALPAEFSATAGSECHTELGLSEHISQRGFCPGIRCVVPGLCGYILGQGHSYLL